MRIHKIELKNFRCYENLTLELDPNFNIIVGINGTGKTAILEALRIAIGSLFLDVDKHKDKISSPGINEDDVRLSHLERQYPVSIVSEGEIFGSSVSWKRNLDTHQGRTKFVEANEMKTASADLQRRIRENDDSRCIPLIAYYSTDRFKKEKKDAGIVADGSRLRGYYNALDPMTNIKFFLDLYRTETLSALQHNTDSTILAAVNNAVRICVEDCTNIYYDVKRDELIIELDSAHDVLPFNFLSDGVRSTLALAMEIAFRCYLLNPHFGEQAAQNTSGIVLIDEIDLHLHPAWQKKIVKDLKNAFPCIQFVVTTHAPLIIGSLDVGKIFTIENQQAYDFPIQYGKDANSILNVMGTEEMDSILKDKLQNYFLLIEGGQGQTSDALLLREELEKMLGNNHTELQRADMMLKFF